MGSRVKQILLVLLCLAAIPTIGIFSSYGLLGKYSAEFDQLAAAQLHVTVNQMHAKGLTLETFCTANASEEVCGDLAIFSLVRSASEWGIASGILLVLIVIGAAYVGRNDRNRLAIAFAIVPRLAMLALAISVLIQGAILVYLSYEVPAVFSGHYYPKLTGLVGLGAIVVAWQLLKYALAFFKRYPMNIVGVRLSRESAPGLFQLVDETAARLSAQTPANIVVGLEPNFFVTATDVSLFEEPKAFSGTTLYLSLPFLAILSKAELSAVLGHELGHFVGADTAYSMRFSPAYTRMHSALSVMQTQTSQKNSTAALWALPSLIVLAFLYSEFSIAERTIGRTRELEADRLGASVSNAHALISALLKVSEYAEIWTDLRAFNVERLNEGKVLPDLASIFDTVSKERYQGLNFDASVKRLADSRLSHPTDTHPTTLERMSALGVGIDEVSRIDLAPDGGVLEGYFQDAASISEALSVKEHRLMLTLGYAQLPTADQAAVAAP